MDVITSQFQPMLDALGQLGDVAEFAGIVLALGVLTVLVIFGIWCRLKRKTDPT